jgi:RNA polymerase sigma factor (sigma-70 family)
MATDLKKESALLRHTRTLFVQGTLSGLTDAELLERFVERRVEWSELAFTALMERHAGMVMGACRRVLDNSHDVQDAFQATFLALIYNARSIRSRQSIAGWLHSVAYRIACSARSADRRRRFHEHRFADRSARGSAYEVYQDRDLKTVLDYELSLLPECQREVLVLCDLEGLTYHQAAQTLGWPTGTVKSRLARGRDRLRSRLTCRGIAPSLVVTGDLWSRNCATAQVPSAVLQSTLNTVMTVGCGRLTSKAISPAVLKLMRGTMMSMLIAKGKLPLVSVVIASCLVGSISFFVAPNFGTAAQQTREARSLTANEQKPGADLSSLKSLLPTPAPRTDSELPATQPEQPSQVKPPVQNPNPPRNTNPSPWETVARIRVQAEGSVGFGTGTVIQSSSEESIIITCAHILKSGISRAKAPPSLPTKIMVDLFDGKLRVINPLDGNRQEAQVTFVESVEGQAIEFDFNLDIGLIRIRPGRPLPSSRVVPRRWQPQPRMKMMTAGCSEGQDATFWSTDVIGLTRHGLAGNPSYEAIECRIAPKQGRTGGGLFTTDNYLAGVCNYAEPLNNVGLYATPRSIYQLLERNGLSVRFEDQSPETPAEGIIHPARDNGPSDEVPARARVLDEIREKLDKSIVFNQELEREVKQVRSELSSLRNAAGLNFTAPAAGNDGGLNRSNPVKEPPVARPSTTRASNPSSTTDPERERFLRSGGLIFAVSPTGNKVIAYNPRARTEQVILLNANKESPLEVSFVDDSEVVGLNLKGTRITRTAAYDLRAGGWIPLELSEPVIGELKSQIVGNGTVAYDAGRHLYTFGIRTGKWDHFDLGSISDTREEEGIMKPVR